MKRIFIIIAVLMLICVNLSGCRNEDPRTMQTQEDEVILIEDKSYLSDFEVTGDKVHIYCVVSLENTGDSSENIKLIGDFENEVGTGLLRSGVLEAHFMDEDSDTITLDGNSSINYVKVEFVGEYAGTSTMSSKELPSIEIVTEE